MEIFIRNKVKKSFCFFYIFFILFQIYSVDSFIRDGHYQKDRNKNYTVNGNYLVNGKIVDLSNILNNSVGNFIIKNEFIDLKTDKVYIIGRDDSRPLKLYCYDEKTQLFSTDYIKVYVPEAIEDNYYEIKDIYNNKLLFDTNYESGRIELNYEIIVDIYTGEENHYKLNCWGETLGFKDDLIFFNDGFYSITTGVFTEYEYPLGFARLDYNKENIIGFLGNEVCIYEIDTGKLIHTKVFPKRVKSYYYHYKANNCFMNDNYLYIEEDVPLCWCNPWRFLEVEAQYEIYIYDRKTFKKIKKLKTKTQFAFVYK